MPKQISELQLWKNTCKACSHLHSHVFHNDWEALAAWCSDNEGLEKWNIVNVHWRNVLPADTSNILPAIYSKDATPLGQFDLSKFMISKIFFATWPYLFWLPTIIIAMETAVAIAWTLKVMYISLDKLFNCIFFQSNICLPERWCDTCITTHCQYLFEQIIDILKLLIDNSH